MVRRRRNWPFDDFDDFDSFFDMDMDREFERMRRMMDMMMERAMSGEMGEPMVYGFSMKVGPDGKPIIQEFGNTRPVRQMGSGSESSGFAREPLTDVMESDDTVTITVELPGVSKEDIDLRINGDRAVISVDTASRKYYKEIELPAEVDQNDVKATYNNGILDITLKKLKKSEPEGKRIEIE